LKYLAKKFNNDEQYIFKFLIQCYKTKRPDILNEQRRLENSIKNLEKEIEKLERCREKLQEEQMKYIKNKILLSESPFFGKSNYKSKLKFEK
jgi:hypothetical protein